MQVVEWQPAYAQKVGIPREEGFLLVWAVWDSLAIGSLHMGMQTLNVALICMETPSFCNFYVPDLSSAHSCEGSAITSPVSFLALIRRLHQLL